MAFYLYNGNDVGAMARILAEMAFSGGGDPLAVETVVVPNPGMGKWLSLEIAEACGFCPQIEFVRPGRFLYQYIFNPMMGRAGAIDESTFVPDVTQWQIYDWLGECDAERVRTFVQGDAQRRWQLACRLARLFDQYMTTRQAMLAEWERGIVAATSPSPSKIFHDGDGDVAATIDEKWQAELWRSLVKGRTDYFSALCRKAVVQHKPPRPSGTPPQEGNQKKRFFFFGMDTLPQCHVDVVMKFAETADVYFFMYNPCATLWDDVKNRKAEALESLDEPLSAFYEYQCNPLLGNLGRLGRDFFVTMLNAEGWNGEAGTAFYPLSEATLLQKIQGDIQDNRKGRGVQEFRSSGVQNGYGVPPAASSHSELLNSRTPELPSSEDGSLRIHACYGALREVETLRDQLWRAFAEIPGLQPRDVRVHVTDMALYAPYIEAVFGNTHIPFTIADKSLAEEYAECKGFVRILEVARGRFGVTEVVEVLSLDAVRERLGFSDEDVQVAGRLLSASNVAWGIDGAHRREMGAGESSMHTWEFALERLVLGVAMESRDQRPETRDQKKELDSGLWTLDSVPCDAAEGYSHIVGGIAALFEKLMAVRRACADGVMVPCGEWMERMRAWALSFYGEPETEGVRSLFQAFSDTEAQVERSGVNPAMPFGVVLQSLAETVEAEGWREDAVSGRVTFCRFTTLASVPARVVGMLGMNEGVFPAVAQFLGFDMQRHGRRRAGDVTTQDRDRYAFLEALLAARDRLIVTYTGQSMRDNVTLPPSSVVAELLAVTGSDVVVRHSLLPTGWRGAGVQEFRSSGVRNDKVAEVSPPPSLEELIAFFRSPVAYYYANVLGTRIKIDDEDVPEDDEPITVDGLMKYQLKEKMTESLMKKGEEAARQEWDRTYASGALPVYAAGAEEEVMTAAHSLKRKAESIPDKDGATVLTRPTDKEKGKDVLRALLTLLMTRQRVIAVYEDEAISYAVPDDDTMQKHLQELEQWFAEGQSRPLCFDADMWWEIIDTKAGQVVPERLAKAWTGDAFGSRGADDVAQYHFGDNLNEAEFLTISRLFCDIVRDLHREKIG